MEIGMSNDLIGTKRPYSTASQTKIKGMGPSHEMSPDEIEDGVPKRQKVAEELGFNKSD